VGRALYLDACATSPPHPEVLAVMREAETSAWANPSSLHGPGLVAAECLERSRQTIAELLGCRRGRLVFTSGGSEAIHLALRGYAAALPGTTEPRRLVMSSVEHPASLAAANQLRRQGWQLALVPVDREGLVDLSALAHLLRPPTRLVSLIWGQNEVGAVQPVEAIGSLCRRAGVPLHVDAVQVLGHHPVDFDALPLAMLSGTAHKLQGPRGVGLLLTAPDIALEPLIGGGGQEGGLRGGTEPVVLVAGFAAALRLATERLTAAGGVDPLARLRDGLLERLLALPGLRLSGPDPRRTPGRRLPHHLSLLIRAADGRPLPGRPLVRELAGLGIAAGSGSACSSSGAAASPVLEAIGCDAAEAASGLRLSLGPWLEEPDLETVAERLLEAMRRLERGAA
jgi:cysteine desulfurase